VGGHAGPGYGITAEPFISLQIRHVNVLDEVPEPEKPVHNESGFSANHSRPNVHQVLSHLPQQVSMPVFPRWPFLIHASGFQNGDYQIKEKRKVQSATDFRMIGFNQSSE
jgi:hypothetical protein